MGYQTKNYSDGDKLVIGGVLEIVGEGQILKDGALLPLGVGSPSLADGAITTAKLASGAVTSGKLASGAVTLAKLGTDAEAALANKLTANKAAAQADSTATDIAGMVADFNALLAKLRAAGIME